MRNQERACGLQLSPVREEVGSNGFSQLVTGGGILQGNKLVWRKERGLE